MKFRKKPIVVEAEQYTGPEHVPLGGPYPTAPGGVRFKPTNMSDAEPFIQTLEGEMHVSPGDWIITGVKGEKYPCKPDIFAASYEPVPAMLSGDEASPLT